MALAGGGPVWLARADELEVLRLSLGDLRSPAERAGGRPLPVGLLLAEIALAADNYHTGLCLL